MNIGLLDIDGHHFPNLVLMKLSSYHKKMGNNVGFYSTFEQYDIVYKSKVFTYSQDYPYFINNTIKIKSGGTGYKMYDVSLPDKIEHIMPDYSLYKTDKAYGFLTRGCPNKCSWCVVPRKEGNIRANADITEFWSGQKEAVLMDNNVLTHEHGLKQIEKIINLGIKIDFNQGLDARIIARDKGIAHLLSRVKWSSYLRMACDTKGQIPYIERALANLNSFGFKNYRVFVYVLVRDIDDALERINFLKQKGCNPFAQPYIDFENKTKVTKEQKRLARWTNHKAIFKTVDFADYR